MSNVVPFRGPQEREADTIRSTAQDLIEEFGAEAGLRLGRLARSAALDDATRARLLKIEAEIEERQGFSWYFGDERPA